MKFKLIETIDKSYERFFKIRRNESGNYCAYHKDEELSNKRVLISGREYIDPFCWSGRKTILVDALNDFVKHSPELANKKFMEKSMARMYGVHTYDGQELPHKEMNENAIGNNNEINKKKYKKHSQSPFVKMNHGDPEVNRKAFNAASNVGKIPTSGSGMSGNGDAGASSGGDAGGGCCESIQEDMIDYSIKSVLDRLHSSFPETRVGSPVGKYTDGTIAEVGDCVYDTGKDEYYVIVACRGVAPAPDTVLLSDENMKMSKGSCDVGSPRWNKFKLQHRKSYTNSLN